MKIKLPAMLKNTLLAVLLVLILAISFMMYQTWKYPGTIEEKIPLYSYSQKVNVDYKANYRYNILTGAVTVGAGETYITNYLNNIATAFNYEFKGERAARYTGEYDVSAVLIGWRKEQEKVVTIWKKEYQLVPKTPFQGTDALINLSKELPLNLRPYNQFVERFVEETKINSDVDLVVRWNVALEVSTNQGIIKESAAPTLVIPINKNYFNIAGEQKKEKKGAIEQSISKTAPINKKLLSLLGTAAGLLSAALLLLVFFTTGIKVTNPLEKRMADILKKHGERLAALSNEVIIGQSALIRIKSLEDLIKIADELTKPVMYKYDAQSLKLPEFYVFDDPKVYSYELQLPPQEPRKPRKGKIDAELKVDSEVKSETESV